jgi:S-adenosylmethionine hydrolase
LSVITLLTDFGNRDGYAGIMKGVIWSIAPQIQIADITHEIAPQNVLEGSLILGRCISYFPPGTVHVAVVDPGVGTSRHPIAVRLGLQYFVGPDNGLVTLWLENTSRDEVKAVLVDKSQFWLPEISSTFHGRDIFAPVAAHLANGVTLEELGSPLEDLQLHDIPKPLPTTYGWQGQVIYIDRFGNCATNLGCKHLATSGKITLQIKHRKIHGMIKSYAERSPGEIVALLDSSGRIEIAAVNASAAQLIQIRVGNIVKIHQ